MKYTDMGASDNLEWLCYLYYATGKGNSTIEDLDEQRYFYRKLVEKYLGLCNSSIETLKMQAKMIKAVKK